MEDTQKNDERWIALFDSIHHVIAAEALFNEHGVWCDLVPVPRDLSSDCGMAVAFKRCDLDRVRELAPNPKFKARGYFRPVADGHEQVSHHLRQ